MPDTNESREALVREYFDVVDGRKLRNPLELFAPDAEVYFPKFGIAQGAENLMSLGHGLHTIVKRLEHHVESFRLHHAGTVVIVEGTTQGETVDGRQWDGKASIGGRFCSVFEVNNNKIIRMYTYLDPDYGHADADRYPWPRERPEPSK
ncbi:hypothetical protein BWI15_00110 [Kribbella sp. ALI-6-A]|uniref:nuclear transport factor 2 family protein n=1 Tax=Kribbella sp. ALI-6-A TaxID=1933817 RepID=UPI00097BD0E1|nr:nuclear transport factor 2 family protein [Kribbella sp. ALI-6-A]ONI79086.1 hypothetical protein BWI15_00110 [Kribbella sp. ALI-6-A]